MKSLTLLIVWATCLVLAGCATPPSVLEEANLTVGMIGELKGQVDNYRKAQQAEDKYRSDFIAGQRGRISKFRTSLDEFTPALVAPVVKDQAETYERLRKISDVRATRIATSPVAVELKLVDPLPDVGPHLSAAQLATAPLAAELSAKERLETIQQFADDIHKSIKDDLKKLEDAKSGVTAKQPAVPAQ